MTEDVNIKISSEIDTKGLDQLRKQLNESRNEMNAVARQLDKTSQEYKNLKASVSEVNRIIKLSDTDLKSYTQSLIVQDKQVQQITRSKGTLMTSTDRLSKSFTMLKTNVGQYSSTLVNLTGDIASGDKSMMQSVGSLGLYAGGWAAVASAVFLATQNIVEWMNKDSAAIQQMEANMPKTGDILGGTDGSLSKYDKKRTGLFFDYNIGPQYDLSQNPYGPTREDMPGQFDAERRIMIAERDRLKIGNAGNQLKTKDIQLTNELINKQEELNKLRLIESTFTADQRGQLVYINYLQKVLELEQQIAGLNLSSDFLKITAQTSGTLESRLTIGQIQQPKSLADINKDIADKTSRDTLEDIQAGYSLISQAMTLLNIGTDTFVGKLMAVFSFASSALSIGSSIFKFITSIIPGGGGMAGMAGMPSMSGGGVALDTNRMINQSISMSSSPVNIYMSSNVNQKYFKAQIESYNKMKQYTRI
jgi:hypothetical protein